jgi:hypothetical protein
MEREILLGGSNSALAHALAGDRHYDGLQAPDGTDISSRTKHREYMKRTGVTMSSDFSQTWDKATKERLERRAGTHTDKKLVQILDQKLHRSIHG